MRKLTDEERKYLQKKLLELAVAFKDICDAEGIWYSLAFGSVLGSVRHKGFIPWDTDIDVFIKLPDKQRFREAYMKHKPDGIKLVDCSKEARCLKSHDCLMFEQKEEVWSIHLDIFQLVGAPSNTIDQNRFVKYAHYADKIVRSKYVDIRQVQHKNFLKVLVVKIALFFVPDFLLKKNISNREYKYSYDKSEYLMALSGYGKGRECIPKEIFNEVVKGEFCGELFNIPKNYDAYLRQIYGDNYMTPIRY